MVTKISKSFIVLFLTIILTLVSTVQMTYAQNWLPEGSSLTIESDEGISPLSYSTSHSSFLYGHYNTSNSMLFDGTISYYSVADGNFPSNTNVSLPPITVSTSIISSSDVIFVPFYAPSINSIYGGVVSRFDAVDNPSIGLFNRSSPVSGSDAGYGVDPYNSTSFYIDDEGKYCVYVPFFVNPAFNSNSSSDCFFGHDGTVFYDSTLYADGNYPPVSYLYSLAPGSYTSKPVYYNAIQVYSGNESLGSYNGGWITGATSFRILSDYIPSQYDIYNIHVAVSTSPLPSQLNLLSHSGGCRISSSTRSVGLNNMRIIDAVVTFDGNTKISDLRFSVGGSATNTCFKILGAPTLVHESFASFLLYQPGSSLSGGSGDGNMQAIVDAIESADSNNVDAVEAAQSIITANANANSNKQIQAAESIASEEMSQAESQHQELVYGYDVDSSASASNSSLESAVDELAGIESQIDSQISDGVSSLESLFEPANWNEVSQGFAVINNLINRLYEGAGIWQIVFQLTLILGLASMLLAGYMFVTGRLHRK